MEITPLRALKSYERDKKIRVRLCRIWNTKSITASTKILSFDCILVDSQGDAIHASAKARDCDFFSAKLQVGAVYEITNFYTIENKSVNKVVPHSCAIDFTRRTKFELAHNVHPRIPRHRFYVADYNDLPARIDETSQLTDILGHIAAMQPLEQKLIQGVSARLESKREFILENLRKQQVRVTLWGECAKNFNEEALQLLSPPVIAVFTSLKIKQFQGKPVLSSTNATLYFFDPEIVELDTYKRVFGSTTSPIQLLPASAASQMSTADQKMQRKSTIEELLGLDPDTNKNVNFICRATIIDFDLTRGWWYNACPTCFKQLRESSSSTFICPTHKVIDKPPLPWYKLTIVIEDHTEETSVLIIGKPAQAFLGQSCYSLVVEEGQTDSNILPDEIRKITGQTKIFQLRFGNLKNDLGRNDLLVYSVFDDELPVQQTMVTLEKIC